MFEKYHLKWLIEEYDKSHQLKFLFFYGHINKMKQEIGDFCLSQWYELPFVINNIIYPTAEHWMMAGKALLFGDEEIHAKIIKAATAGEAKKLGRQVKNFDEATWNANRFDIVVQGNIHKFEQHIVYCNYLINTGNRILVEASPVDVIWGIGLPKTNNNISNPHLWRGLNLLGFALMEARDKLRISRDV